MMEKALVLWCLLASLILFLTMGADKGRAKKGKRRIAEKTLFAWALLGGAPGGWLGMKVFRHKTKHWYFKFGFPLLAILEAAGIAALLIWRQ